MTLHINGEPRDVPSGLTVASLVAHMGMKQDRVAVELNREIVPRAKWETTAVQDGDRLEIVHFVGGGSGSQIEEESTPIVDATNPSGAGWVCPTCGEQATRAFCPNCGEKKSSRDDFSLQHFFTHALGEFFHFDSKIFRTCRLLFTRPGFLTAEYVRGCRKPYLHPFQVFFVANLIYFVMQPYAGWTGLRTTLYIQTHMMSYGDLAARMVDHRIVATGVTRQQFAASFDHLVDVQARSLAVILVPLSALVLALLQWRKKRFFGEHLVFSLHYTAYWLISILLILYPLATIVLRFAGRHGIHMPPGDRWDGLIYNAAMVVLAAYSSVAIRVAYRDSWVMSLLKGVAVALSLRYVLIAYRFVLFLVALYFA